MFWPSLIPIVQHILRNVVCRFSKHITVFLIFKSVCVYNFKAVVFILVQRQLVVHIGGEATLQAVMQ